jgi:hypothetical protein
MRPTHESNIAMAPATARMYALEQFSEAVAGRRPPRLRPALRRLWLAILWTVSPPGRHDLRSVGTRATPTPD